MDDFTRKFSIAMEKDAEIHQILSTVYQALEEKGYNPINQIVGYILSEDPTYITNHNNARTLIRKIDRDELLQVLVRKYLGQEQIVTKAAPDPSGAEKAAENPVFFTSRGFFLLFCDKCGKKVYFSVKLLSAFC